MPGHIQINATRPRVQYVADGVRREFLFPFAVFEASSLEVYLDRECQLSGFDVIGVGETDGGTVTFATPPTAGVLVTLRRQLTIRRVSDFQHSGQFRAKVLNDEFDYLTASLQQVELEASRAIRLNPTDSESPLLLPPARDRAGHVIVFDQRGDLTTQPFSTASGSLSWTTLDDIPEGQTNRHFAEAHRAKLTSIEGGAQVNPPRVSPEELAVADEIALRSFSPLDVHTIATRVATGATAVTSFNGRTGTVTAKTGDYAADQIADTLDRVIMTSFERGKLFAIEEGAQVNPPVVSAAEKITATQTAIRSFSPKDIKDLIAASIGEFAVHTVLDGGNAYSTFNALIDGGSAHG